MSQWGLFVKFVHITLVCDCRESDVIWLGWGVDIWWEPVRCSLACWFCMFVCHNPIWCSCHRKECHSSQLIPHINSVVLAGDGQQMVPWKIWCQSHCQQAQKWWRTMHVSRGQLWTGTGSIHVRQGSWWVIYWLVFWLALNHMCFFEFQCTSNHLLQHRRGCITWEFGWIW